MQGIADNQNSALHPENFKTSSVLPQGRTNSCDQIYVNKLPSKEKLAGGLSKRAPPSP